VVTSRSLIRQTAALLGQAVPLVLGLACCSGCGGDRYPQDLGYPVRTDPLVTKIPDPKTPPAEFDKPGQFEHMFDDPNYPPLTIKVENQFIVRFPGVDPRTGKDGIRPANRDKLRDAEEKLFGTPRFPRVNGIDRATRRTLKLTNDALERGSQLYRLHCVHCHGLSGDGRGHTAPWVNPHPRDYRQGVFKFTSSSQEQGVRKPRRADLIRTVRQGVEGTSMPAFNLLPEPALEDLISYVIHLSIRGESEFNVMSDAIGGKFPRNAERALREELKGIAKNWADAQGSMIKPAAGYPYATADGRPIVPGGSNYNDEEERILRKSVRNGYEIFTDQKKSVCGGCHLDFGRRSLLAFDAWGTIIRPQNLTTGVFRGGRRPIDLYWRIYSGINGVNMPKFDLSGDTPEQGNKKVWDLVNFIQVLPYPAMREKYGININ
jgi:mono/diheme cytochrome c family protein